MISDGGLRLLKLDALPAKGRQYLVEAPTLFRYASAEFIIRSPEPIGE